MFSAGLQSCIALSYRMYMYISRRFGCSVDSSETKVIRQICGRTVAIRSWITWRNWCPVSSCVRWSVTVDWCAV